MKRLSELEFGALTSYVYPGGYNQDQLGLGPNIQQNNGATGVDDYVGPNGIQVIRPMEFTTNIPGVYPWAMQWSSTLDWVFLADNAATAATRRVIAATYNRSTGAFGIQGFITITYPTATNHTIRALRMTYDLHTTGTVAVSGTAVTGTSTAWQTNRACVGNRIGFGSTDPTQISTWYEISAIGSDSSITLTTSAGTISSGTAYVIEDLRAIMLNTNATTTNGGLFVVKGLRFETFSSAGTAISAATTTDNIRACYWLADASTVTNTVGLGLALEPITSFTSHICWALDTTTNPVLFKYNLRGALTLTGGKDTTTLVFKTGSGGALSGTASQANNGRYAAASHGPGSGSSCIYFTTTTRIYRTIATSSITTGSTTFLADNDVEIPPGGTSTMTATGALNSIEYAASIDKFIVATNSATTSHRSYVTQYRTDSGQWDRCFGVDTRQIDQSAADSSITPVPTPTGGAYSVWSEGGMLYIATIGTTALTNRVYALPLSADWEYHTTTNSCVVTPRIACTDIDKFSRAWVMEDEVLGGSSGKNLGYAPEPYKLYYRTSGISDNSGSWTELASTGSLSGVDGASYIQFKIAFRMMGLTCIPARIHAVGVSYEDLSTLSNYQLSVTLSDASNKRFAWRHAVAFGSSVPALRVRLYDAVSGSLLVDDNTTSPTGTFERSTNGGSSWSAFSTSDKGNDTTYIRYTPSSLADNISVRPVLTLA